MFFATSAHAGAVLTSPALPSTINDATTLQCLVINISTKPVDVVIDIWNGTMKAVEVSATTTLNPGGRYYVASPAVDSTLFCRATGLNTKTGRISFYALDGSVNVLAVVSAP